MHQSRRLSVGVDVPKAAMAGADSAPAPHAAVVSLGHIGTRQGDIDQLLRRLQATSPHLGFGYEAGPCGSWLSRSLPQKAQGCWGVAPSLSPTKPGDRGTTNRQDASKRARLLRAGTLPPVSGPALEEAALRALCRARAEAIRALQTAQCRLTAFLLRHARRAPGQAPWGPAHRRGRSSASCKKTFERAPPTRHGVRVWHTSAQPTCRPGGSPPSSTPSRPCVEGHGRSP